MKILSAAQTRALDHATLREQGITSAELMERAGEAVVDWLTRQLGLGTFNQFLVLCGPGNNGGDGLVVARLLHLAGFRVRVGLLAAEKFSPDWQHNRRLLPAAVPVGEIEHGQLPDLTPNTVVIDALFGTGLSRPLEGPVAALVQTLNAAGSYVLAVDTPSGLFSEAPQPLGSFIVRARHTISFGPPKLAFLLPQNAGFVGEWHVEDIGLSEPFTAATVSPWHYTDAAAAGTLPLRPKFAHKGTFGHALLLAGSRGKVGAAVLAAGACLRGGVGLLTSVVPGCGYDIFQTSAPEAMCLADPEADFISELPDLEPYQAVGIGSGLGQHAASLGVLRQLLTAASAVSASRPTPLPLVIDADALNLLGQHRELLALLPENAVLTPHPKEFERLTEPARDDYHRLELLRDFAQRYRCLVLLKGAYSCLATPSGELHFNSSGNPGMATGGSGDVLTGLLLALRAHAQLPAFEAVRLGVFAHGRAGDLAAAHTGQAGLVAGDIVRHIGPALQ